MTVRARRSRLVRGLGLSLMLLCSAFGRVALADSADIGTAELLFREGKQRLVQNDYARACPLLAESFRLDPASGALLALALCHEREGKLASAAREYNEVAVRSQQEGRADRVQAAHAKALALQDQLSSLTIRAATGLAGLQVSVNGTLVDRDRLERPMPVDGGDHLIEVTALDKQPWSVRVAVARSMDAKTIEIPALQSADPVAPVVAPGPDNAPRLSKARVRRQARGLSAEQWLGLGTIGAGLVGLGVGTFLAVRDGSEQPAANPGCAREGLCRGPDSDQGDMAALAFVVGGALAATGTVIYLVSGAPSSVESAAVAPTLAAGVWAAKGAGGAALQGHF